MGQGEPTVLWLYCPAGHWQPSGDLSSTNLIWVGFFTLKSIYLSSSAKASYNEFYNLILVKKYTPLI